MNTGSNKLLSGSATYLVSNVANAAIPFALLPVLTRYMNPGEYGQVAMYQTLFAALAAIIGISVHGAAGVKYYDHDITPNELAQFIGACFQILCATTIIAFLACLAVLNPLAASLGLRPEWVLWTVIASSAGFIIQMRLGQWQVRGEAVKYGTLQTFQSLANAALSLILVVMLMQGAAGRIDAQNWVLIASALLATYLLARDKLIVWSWRPEYIREALRFGVPLIPHVAGIFLLSAVDRLVINSKLGVAQAGIYMVAVQLTMVMSLVFSAVNNAYAPWLYERLKRNNTDEKQQIVRWTYLYFVVVLALAGLAFIIGPLAVTLIAGEQYRAAGKVIGWLALGQAFGGMYLMVTNYIFYSKRTGMLATTTIASGLFNLMLLFFLISRSGIVGAAMAFALSNGLRFLATWVVAQMCHPMPWLDQTILRMQREGL